MRWLVATVAETVPETVSAVTVRLDVEGWAGHRAGQHVDLRLTAEDGYSAQRSYSIASPPGAERLELTVVRIDDGEVSPYVTTVLEVGDQIELRGPIGGYFVWDGEDDEPVLLVGGGSGVVPLMAILRHHIAIDAKAPIRLVYSARSASDVLYRSELSALPRDPGRDVVVTLTRDTNPTPGWRQGRVDAGLLAEGGWGSASSPRCYVCGPTGFVEAVARILVGLGHPATNVLTERFGPTGG